MYGISVEGLAPKFEAKLSHYKQLDVPLIRRDTKIEHSAGTSKIAKVLGAGDLEKFCPGKSLDFVGWKRLSRKRVRLFGWNTCRDMEDGRLQVVIWSVA